MKASDAKQFIGKKVKYKRHMWAAVRYGVVQSTFGRNIFLEDDTLWAPDIAWMEEYVPEQPCEVPA